MPRLSGDGQQSGRDGPRRAGIAVHFVDGSDDAVDVIELGPRQRLNPLSVGGFDVLVVSGGMLAVETTPVGGRRQVLDFVISGDVVLVSGGLEQGLIYLRAVSGATLVGQSLDQADASAGAAIMAGIRAGQARRDLHQIMIGQLDAEPRAATFLLSLAWRCQAVVAGDPVLEMPMSRDDVADYLAMNPDTLSRIMMRFETLGLIRRTSRHVIGLKDIDGLAKRTPLRPQLIARLSDRQPDAAQPAQA